MSGNSKKELLLFFAFTLLVMYTLCFAVVLFLRPLQVFSHQHLAGLDPQLLLYPAAYSPTLVALILTGARGGRQALKELLARVFRWRVGVLPWLMAFLLLPAIWLLVAVLRHFTVGAPIRWEAWLINFPALVFSPFLFTDTGGLGEETGWRGYAMPRLLEGFSPAAAGLIVGFFFGIWHLPGWFLSGLGGQFAHWDFAMFVTFTMMLSVLLGFIYVHAQGSVLLAGIIPHMVTNIGTETGVKFYEMTWEFSGYFALIVFVLATVFARRMFSPGCSYRLVDAPHPSGGLGESLAHAGRRMPDHRFSSPGHPEQVR